MSARTRTTPVLERVALTASKVDREKRVIHGVKVLGTSSDNGRAYPIDVIKRAAPLYEKARVFKGHPKKPTDNREAEELFGWLENVQVKDDGLYADLCYFEADGLSSKVCEAAERNSNAVGLSHNADAAGRYQDGTWVAVEITEVRSVDLVTSPATTSGLFESKGQPMKLTKKSLLESLKGWKGDARLKTLYRRVLEMADTPDEMAVPADTPAPDADPAEALKAGFKASAVALLDAALDGDQEAMKKLVDLVKSHAKVNPGQASEEEEEPAEGEEEPVEEEEDEEQGGGKMESRKIRKELDDLKREKKVRELCEDAGLAPTRAFVATLMEARSDRVIKTLIDQQKQIGQGVKKGGPKSSAPGRPVLESKDTAPDDPKALARWLTS